MKLSRPWLVLSALMSIWAGVAAWQFGAAEPQRVPLIHRTGQTGSHDVGRGKRGALHVRLDLLDENRERATAFADPKNIFAPLDAEGDKPKAFAVARSSKARKAADAPLPAAGPPPTPSAPPMPTEEELSIQRAQMELAQFRYLGYLNRQGREEAFLSRDRELLIVRVGELIGPQVRIKAVTPTGVTLEETNAHIEKTVFLVEPGTGPS